MIRLFKRKQEEIDPEINDLLWLTIQKIDHLSDHDQEVIKDLLLAIIKMGSGSIIIKDLHFMIDYGKISVNRIKAVNSKLEEDI